MNRMHNRMTGFVFCLSILLDERVFFFFFFFRTSGYTLSSTLVEYSSDDIVEWRLFKIYMYLNKKNDFSLKNLKY